MPQVNVVRTINAPADFVWNTVRAFSGLEQYFSAFVSSTVEGSGVGATRVLNLGDGGQFVERLESVEDKTRTLTYRILQCPLPIENYVGTVTVEDAGDGTSRVTWSSTFDASKDAESSMVEMFDGAYADGIGGLEMLFKA